MLTTILTDDVSLSKEFLNPDRISIFFNKVSSNSVHLSKSQRKPTGFVVSWAWWWFEVGVGAKQLKPKNWSWLLLAYIYSRHYFIHWICRESLVPNSKLKLDWQLQHVAKFCWAVQVTIKHTWFWFAEPEKSMPLNSTPIDTMQLHLHF